MPIPTDVVRSTAQLKNWATSWSRSNKLWIRSRDEDDILKLHWFKISEEVDDVPFMTANLTPGGEFVVALYTDGKIDLKEIRIRSDDEWDLQKVAQYKQDHPEETDMAFRSQLLTETNLGYPLVAYVNDGREKYFFFFLRTTDTTLIGQGPAFWFSTLTTLLASLDGNKWWSFMMPIITGYMAFTQEAVLSRVFTSRFKGGWVSPFLSWVQIRPSDTSLSMSIGSVDPFTRCLPKLT